MDAEELLGVGEDFDEEFDDELAGDNISQTKENLKISIDNKGASDPDIAFVKLEKEDDVTPQTTVENQAVKIQFGKSRFSQEKKYVNKSGGFETGMELDSEDARQRRSDRAKRFGITEDKGPALDLMVLYTSLGLSMEQVQNADSGNLRPNVIMLRGVNDLSTKDLWSYFKSYPPLELEWIDDSSCNLVFSDCNTCNRALWNMSKPIKDPKQTDQDKKNEPPSTKSLTEVDETSMDDSIDLNEPIGSAGMDPRPSQPSEKQKTDEEELEEGEFEDIQEDGCILDESDLPPGRWRVAMPHPNSKNRLFMRLATTADKKVKGAEKRSKYYMKYGNPNYGGMKGLISNTRKKRFRQQQYKIIEEEAHEAVSGGRSKVIYDDEDIFGGETLSEDLDSNISSGLDATTNAFKNRKRRADPEEEEMEAEINQLLEVTEPKKKKTPMMRMAADEEEEKIAAEREYHKSLLKSFDIRTQLDRNRQDRALLSDSRSFQYKPDLRSRLSRANE